MTHASLFSGIGGFDLAAHWAGIENVFACEIDEFCRKVLAKRFPNTTLYKDIKETKFEQYCGTIDIISGGFPCQPFSTAGKRAGTADNRYLWGEMLRVVREIKPRWVIAENVRGLTNIADGSTFETVCNDLEISGYEVQPFIIPALSVGAPHRRERVWIVAHANNRSRPQQKVSARGSVYEMCNRGDISGNPPHSNSRGLERTEEKRGQGEYALRSDFGVTDSNDNQQEQPKCDNETGRCSSESWQGNGIGTGLGGEFGDSPERVGTVGRGAEELPAPNAADSKIKRLVRSDRAQLRGLCATEHYRGQEWPEKWIEALTRIYGMDDGLPGGMDGLNERYKDRSRKFRIKAMGNAIVPQIAHLIFNAILEVEREHYA